MPNKKQKNKFGESNRKSPLDKGGNQHVKLMGYKANPQKGTKLRLHVLILKLDRRKNLYPESLNPESVHTELQL